MKNALIAILVLSHSFSFAENSGVGYYHASIKNSDGYPNNFNQLCIRKKSPEIYEVDIFTSYCPSKECMNARMDEIHFQSKLTGKKLKYDSANCKLQITLGKKNAFISQSGDACGDLSLLNSSGVYKFVRSKLKDDDCSPRGNEK